MATLVWFCFNLKQNTPKWRDSICQILIHWKWMHCSHNTKSKNSEYQKNLLELVVAGICFNHQALDLSRLWRQYCATLSSAFFLHHKPMKFKKQIKEKQNWIVNPYESRRWTSEWKNNSYISIFVFSCCIHCEQNLHPHTQVNQRISIN